MKNLMEAVRFVVIHSLPIVAVDGANPSTLTGFVIRIDGRESEVMPAGQAKLPQASITLGALEATPTSLMRRSAKISVSSTQRRISRTKPLFKSLPCAVENQVHSSESASFSALFHHTRPNDLHFINGPVLAASLDQPHPLDNAHAAFDSTEDRVLPIQPRRWCQSDEELAAIRIRSAIRHAQNASTGVLEVLVDFVLEFLAVDRASPTTGAGRITGLDHEVRDDAMEDDVVVIASLREGRKIFACLESQRSAEDCLLSSVGCGPWAHDCCRARR